MKRYDRSGFCLSRLHSSYNFGSNDYAHCGHGPGRIAVMPPRLGLAVYGSPRSLTRIVLRIRPGRYC